MIKKHLNDYAKTSGFNIKVVKEEYSPTVPAGQVIWQNPRQGTEIERGRKVEVVLSKGEEKKPVKIIVTYSDD